MCRTAVVMFASAIVLLLGTGLSLAETSAGTGRQKLSQPGGAGHALLFQNHVAKVPAFKGFPTYAVTFEAWVSTTDYCHSGTILSYAKYVDSPDPAINSAAANHFVIYDSLNVIGCHDYETLAGTPESCANAFIPNKTASMVTNDGSWRHIAVTWNGHVDGTTKIYVDGSLMSTAMTMRTKPLEPDGILLLGQEQDCLGGCTDGGQSFQGLMDEVRIWRTERTQDQIARYMRWTDGLEKDPDLVAYWKFNDPDKDGGKWRAHAIARDASGHGNDLVLVEMPQQFPAQMGALKTGAMSFKGQYAHSWTGVMPVKDFTIEFWARLNSLETPSGVVTGVYNTLLDYATRSGGSGVVSSMDDAIRIERYSVEYQQQLGLNRSTVGAVGVHLNTNWDSADTAKNGGGRTRWIDFFADWVDDKWHHIAVTWEYQSGTTRLFMDGVEKPAFWRRNAGAEQTHKSPTFTPSIAAGTERGGTGSLVLGMDQDCFGGCFNPATPANADMAVLRVWTAARSAAQISRNMYYEAPVEQDDLVFYYTFPKATEPDNLWLESSASAHTLNPGIQAPVFFMYSPAPTFVYSTAPLTTSDGMPVPPPTPGQAGHALSLSDQQVVVAHNFQNFPSTAITVEFWMRSVDTCRQGVPISYATGQYGKGDNSFLIFNYNSLGVAVMEDQGQTNYDVNSGVTVTDGVWHHLAVTWESATGKTCLYVDTNLVWTAVRAAGKSIPSGGTLVIGREQDCQGGCFDSLPGAAGSYDSNTASEYGPQDFTGAIEQVRIWRTVRSQQEIQLYYADDALQRRMGSNHADLVAHWEFDEGTGYRVADLTKNKNDLIILSNPKFEVVKWLGVCGNGVVEGEEECDLRVNGPGTGCTSSCQTEAGWTCSLEPQICRKTGSGMQRTPARYSHHDHPSGSMSGSSGMMSSGGSKGGSGSGHAWGVALGVLAAVAVLGGVGFVGRHALYEHVWLKLRPQRTYRDVAAEYGLVEPPRAMLSLDPRPDYHPLPHGPV